MPFTYYSANRKAPRPIERARGRAWALLRALGSSPQQIARTLEGYAIRGERETPQSCPLSVYLRSALRKEGIRVEVDVESDDAYLDFPASGVQVVLSTAAKSFVRQFDAGRFPQLESPPPQTT